MNDRESKKRRRNIARWVKRGVALAMVGTLVVMMVLALMPKPVAVDVAVAETGALSVSVDEDGTTRVKDRYMVSAPLNGSLARLELDPGDTVKQGELVARLVPLVPAARRAQQRRARRRAWIRGAGGRRQVTSPGPARAKANQGLAKKDIERQRELADKGIAARESVDRAVLAERTANADFESSKFGAKVADYEVEVARAALGRLGRKVKPGSEEQLLVVSPVAGRVLRVLHKSEGVVQAGTPLVEVGDPAALEIVVDVLTSDAVHVRPGSEARITEWGGSALAASVRIIEPSAFTRLSALGVEEQRVNVVLDPKGPPQAWANLGDGYRVKAEIVTHEKADALQVPASAVFRRDSGWAVFRVDGPLARLVPVQIGLRTQRRVEVTEGLEPGARVVLHPSDRIADGVKVVVR